MYYRTQKICHNFFVQYSHNLKDITPLETWNLIIEAFFKA